MKLRGKQVEFKTSKLLFRALGMENVLNPGSETKMNIGHASYYEKPISEEELLVGYNGEIGGLSGNYLNYNQYGRAYLIPGKTTPTACLYILFPGGYAYGNQFTGVLPGF